MKAMVAAGLLTIASLVSGCDYRPLYGTTDAGSPVAQLLAGIKVTEQNTRLGQLVRNEIVASISPVGTQGNDRYTLDLAADEGEFTSIDSINTEPIRLQHRVNAQFTLFDNRTGKAVHAGKTFSQVSYDRVDSPAANLQAQTNAQERAAREVGRDIRIRLAAWFSKNGDH